MSFLNKGIDRRRLRLVGASLLAVSIGATGAGCSDSAVVVGDSGVDGGTTLGDTGTTDAKVQKAAIPSFSVPGGTYSSSQNVTITSATTAATIYYTVDGNTPNKGSIKYTTPVAVSATTTLRAIAIADGYDDSDVNSATYTIEKAPDQAAAPVITPAGGTFTSAQTVTMTTTEAGGRIFFTTDGTLPTSAHGTLYTSAISVATDTTLIAVTNKTNKIDSNPTTAVFKISVPPGVVAAPSLSPASGEYTDKITLTMSTTTASATICYTTDGNTPTCDPTKALDSQCTGTSLRYTTAQPVTLDGTKTVKAIGCAAGMTTSSQGTGTYTFRAAVPTVTAGSGTVLWGTKPLVNVVTSGSTVLVTKTVDGTTPADPDVAVAGTCTPATGTLAQPSTSFPADISSNVALAFPFASNSAGLGLGRNAKYKVRGCKAGYSLSAVASLDYTVKLNPTTLHTNDATRDATTAAPAFGVVNSTLTVFGLSNAGIAGGSATGPTDVVGTACWATGTTVPACNAAKTGCTTGTAIAPAALVAGGGGGVVIDTDGGALKFNKSDRRNFNVVACRPSTADSDVLSGQWTWQANAAIFTSTSNAGAAEATPPTSINVGQELNNDTAAQHVSFGLFPTGKSAYTDIGAGALRAAYPGLQFYYTVDGTDPVVPTGCTGAGVLPTRQADYTDGGGGFQFNLAASFVQPAAGSTFKAIACSPDINASAIATKSFAAPGQLPAPTITPAAGTYSAILNNATAAAPYVKITRGTSDASGTAGFVCVTSSTLSPGATPACSTTLDQCAVGYAIHWAAGSTDIVFDGATTYVNNFTAGGGAGATATNASATVIVSDNDKGNLRAVACAVGSPSSGVTTNTITFKVPNPNPPADGPIGQGLATVVDPDGAFDQSGNMVVAGLGADVWEWRYTFAGGGTAAATPTCASTLWDNASSIAANITFPFNLKMIACRAAGQGVWSPSDVVSRTYTSLVAPAPMIYAGTVGATNSSIIGGIKARADGSYTDNVTVAVRSSAAVNMGNARGMCYTTDGTTPTCGGTVALCGNGINVTDGLATAAFKALVPGTAADQLDLSGGAKTVRAVTCESGTGFTGVVASTVTSATFRAYPTVPTLALTAPPAALISKMNVVTATVAPESVAVAPAVLSIVPQRTTGQVMLWSFDAAPPNCVLQAKVSAGVALPGAVTVTDTQLIPVPKNGTLYTRTCDGLFMESSTATYAVTGMAAYQKSVNAWTDWVDGENLLGGPIGAGNLSHGTTNDLMEARVSFDSATLSLGLAKASMNAGVDLYPHWLLSGATGSPPTATNLIAATVALGGAQYADTMDLRCGFGRTTLVVPPAVANHAATARWLVVAKSATTLDNTNLLPQAKVLEWSGTAWVDVTATFGATWFGTGTTGVGVKIPRASIANVGSIRVAAGIYDPDSGDANNMDCDSDNDQTPDPVAHYIMGEGAAAARQFYVDFASAGSPNYTGDLNTVAGTWDAWNALNNGRLCWTAATLNGSVAGAFSAYCP